MSPWTILAESPATEVRVRQKIMFGSWTAACTQTSAVPTKIGLIVADVPQGYPTPEIMQTNGAPNTVNREGSFEYQYGCWATPWKTQPPKALKGTPTM